MNDTFPRCEMTIYPNWRRRWRNAVLNLRMTCRIVQSNKMAVRTQLPKQIGDAGYRPSHASIMPLVFEGYPRLLSLQPHTIRVKEQEHTPQKTPNLQLLCLGSCQYLISRWPFFVQQENSEGNIWTIIQQRRQQIPAIWCLVCGRHTCNPITCTAASWG